MAPSSRTFRPSWKAATVVLLAAILVVIVVSTRNRSSEDQGRIAASEVSDRESLEGFVTGAKDHLLSVRGLGQLAQLRKIFRADEGDWKSDSLFLMLLAPNGDVLVHGDDPTAENRNISAVEDDQGKKVVQELLAAAERGGGFVEYHWDDPTQPDDEIRKVSYAVQLGSGPAPKVVMVGGYAQDLSQVPVDIADLPRPAITAAEVVDRETLTTFVEEAAKAFRAAYLTEGLSGLSTTRNAFRAEGDWKSGSVYVWVVSDEGYIVFHGSEQHREGQRANLDREDVNGIQFVRELVAAGAAGGGTVEYYYDNPAVEGDEDTGSPKIGYATSFTLPGRDKNPFVVGSGIYHDSDL